MTAMILSVLLAAGTAQAQDYAMPTTAAHYGFFYPTAYYDHDPGAGLQDWNCSTLTYGGHGGSDFGVGGFPGMDAGRDITAAAAGTVIYIEDGWADRCTTGDCAGGGGFGNWVRIRHADGKETSYGHMKQWSVAVAVNDVVACGDHLGQVGSSGRSTGPHLHFDPREGGVKDDPFGGACSHAYSLWVSQGAHGALPSLTCDGGSPTPLTVVADNIAAGQEGYAHVTGANPGETVKLYWSENPGPGPCPGPLGGLCLGVGSPVNLLRHGVANGAGEVTIPVQVTRPVGTQYYAQVAVRRGAGGSNSVASNVETGLVE